MNQFVSQSSCALSEDPTLSLRLLLESVSLSSQHLCAHLTQKCLATHRHTEVN
ncbi:hypothetical protein EXN66_Car004797 [Channa argus]|uniref:Uncharacterized protein n=1 Tax=Channa argus TaxID=215402 RepID=A0A6G1PFS4_CHAAH|nr:hypothetical protein EXN66_Car004797 [Channa argus]